MSFNTDSAAGIREGLPELRAIITSEQGHRDLTFLEDWARMYDILEELDQLSAKQMTLLQELQEIHERDRVYLARD